MSTTIRETYPVFEYQRYETRWEGEDLVLRFTYHIQPDITFHPSLRIKDIKRATCSSNTELIDVFTFYVGMIEMFTYWKATCSQTIRIIPHTLTPVQIAWWHELLMNGMGEYFYKNSFDFTQQDFIRIESVGVNQIAPVSVNTHTHYLVPVGGGIDSAVTLTVLNQAKRDITACMLNPRVASHHLVEALGISHSIVIERTIEPLLLDMNNRGFYNGHTPFSAYLAFVTTLVAALHGYSSVVLSNEQSSNEETTTYKGKPINHQYSKSFAFEANFRTYLTSYICPNIDYFSFLRPLNQLQIASLFSQYTSLHPIVRSCNANAKEGTWCCACAKCMSTFIMLYPFLGPEKILTVFPTSMFEDIKNMEFVTELIDPRLSKPFECVASRDEIRVALYKAIQFHPSDSLPPVLKEVKEKYLVDEKQLKDLESQIMKNWNTMHFVPKELVEILPHYE